MLIKVVNCDSYYLPSNLLESADIVTILGWQVLLKKIVWRLRSSNRLWQHIDLPSKHFPYKYLKVIY